jgi:hypothetical protein
VALDPVRLPIVPEHFADCRAQFSAAFAAESASRIPACVLKISLSAQNVTPARMERSDPDARSRRPPAG